jgi:hypothetical protein
MRRPALVLLAAAGAVMLLSLPLAWQALQAIPQRIGVNYGIYLLLERQPREALDHLHRQALLYPGNPLPGEALLSVALHLDSAPEAGHYPLLESPEQLGDSALLGLLRQIWRYQRGEGALPREEGNTPIPDIDGHALLNREQARWLDGALRARARGDWPTLMQQGPYPESGRPSAGDRAGQLLRLRACFELGDWREARQLLPEVLRRTGRFHADAMGPAAALLLLGHRDDELLWNLHRQRALPLSDERLLELRAALDHALDYLTEFDGQVREPMHLRLTMLAGREAQARDKARAIQHALWRQALGRRLGEPGESAAGPPPGEASEGWGALPLPFRFDALMQRGLTVPEALDAMGLEGRRVELSALTLVPGHSGQFVGEGAGRHLRMPSAGRLVVDLSDHAARHWSAMYALLVVGGEQAEGEWPAVMVSVNQRVTGVACAHRGFPHMIPVYLEAPAGGFSELALHYFNNAVSADAVERGEDRNLVVYGVVLLPATR